MQEQPDKKLDHIKKLISSVYSNLDKIEELVNKYEQEERKKVYKETPGVEGTFDGFYMVDDKGTKYEVPANYAAKSRLVYGDRLKMIDEEGKKVFKQIEKVERKEIEGVLSRKEGKWYLLTEGGSYKVSDVAAEFNNAQLNEQAVGLIPSNNMNAPFATLDKIIRGAPVAEQLRAQPIKAAKAVTEASKEEAPGPQRTLARKPFKAPRQMNRPEIVQPKTTKVVREAKEEVHDIKQEFVADISKKPQKKPFVRPISPSPKKEVKPTEAVPPKSAVLEDDDLR